MTKMTKNELHVQNMPISPLSPYFYYFVLCSDRILMLVLIPVSQLIVDMNMVTQEPIFTFFSSGWDEHLETIHIINTIRQGGDAGRATFC